MHMALRLLKFYCLSIGLFLFAADSVRCQGCSRPTRLVVLGRAPLLHPDENNYEINETVTFSCNNTDDVAVGPPNVTCQDNGTWDIPTAPNCLQKCTDPGNPDNGHKVGTPTFDPFSLVTFACDHDTDTLDGTDTLRCDDGVWSPPTLPLCKLGCPVPGSPANGFQIITNTSLYDMGQIGFDCREGYRTVGSDVIYCNNGTWSDTIPTCTDIDDCSPTACENDGICVDGVNMYNCTCQGGYEGERCEKEMDECVSMPCANNAVCIDHLNGFTCNCTSGWQGTLCNQEINECESSPCDYGNCTDRLDGFECECEMGYIGITCDTFIGGCHSNPCQNNATCDNDGMNFAFNCTCTPGYSGITCNEDFDECNSNPCQNGGRCSDLVNGYMCVCVDGFNGTNCDIDIDECNSNPCQNGGTCSDLVNEYMCNCVDGFNGTDCEMDIDECNDNPCQNGSTCRDLVNGYMCVCVDGFNGTNCEMDIDECNSNPCQNGGGCSDLVNEYMCVCVDGFNGTNCEMDIDECNSNPCLNGGTCNNMINGYTCDCVDGYNGTQCETNIDECASNPCKNGGTCINGMNKYTCICQPGYTGGDCSQDIDECISNPCQNEATCVDKPNRYDCICPDGYDGPNCARDKNECASNPCQHGGNCTDYFNFYTCDCSPGYYGVHCENETDECESNPCKNGGICQDGIDKYNCSCPVGFTGLNCEIDIDDCASNPCQNGGFCVDGKNNYTCNCSAGYAGQHCEIPPDMSLTTEMSSKEMATALTETTEGETKFTTKTSPIPTTVISLSQTPSASQTSQPLTTRPITTEPTSEQPSPQATSEQTSEQPTTEPPSPQSTSAKTSPQGTSEQTSKQPTTESPSPQSTTAKPSAQASSEQTPAQSTSEPASPQSSFAKTSPQATSEQTSEQPTSEPPSSQSTSAKTSPQGTSAQTSPQKTSEQQSPQATSAQTSAQPTSEPPSSRATAAQTSPQKTSEQQSPLATSARPSTQPTSEQPLPESTVMKSPSTPKREGCSPNSCDIETEYCITRGYGYSCHCKAGRRKVDGVCMRTKSFQVSQTITALFGEKYDYSSDLDDAETTTSKMLRHVIITAIGAVLQNFKSSTFTYVDTIVVGFSPGSVVAESVSAFLNDDNLATGELQIYFNDKVNEEDGAFSNMTITNVTVDDFVDSVCILPDSHDCHQYASCIDKDDGTFTCKCDSGYRDDSEDSDVRPGRLCSESSSNQILIVAITCGVLGGLLLIGFILFTVNCCRVYREADKTTMVPVMDDYPPPDHLLVDPGIGVDYFGIDNDFNKDPVTENEYEWENRLSATTANTDERVEDEQIDTLKRHLTNISTRELPFRSEDFDSKLTHDPLATDDTFLRPYVATGNEAMELYRQEQGIPERDYPHAAYFQPRTSDGVKVMSQERKELPFRSEDLDSKLTHDPLATDDTFLRPYVATGNEAMELYRQEQGIPERDYPHAAYFQPRTSDGVKVMSQERKEEIPMRDYPTVDK